jgi:hypothetical protein
MTPAPALEALQNALASEHAAVYGYGLLIPQLTGSAREGALAAFDEHRIRRDRLRGLVAALGAEPTEAAAAYRPAGPVTGAAAATRLATDLERDVALAFGELVAASSDDTRTFAARSLQELAIRQTTWQHAAPRFPGLATDPTATATPSPSPSPTPSPSASPNLPLLP